MSVSTATSQNDSIRFSFPTVRQTTTDGADQNFKPWAFCPGLHWRPGYYEITSRRNSQFPQA